MTAFPAERYAVDLGSDIHSATDMAKKNVDELEDMTRRLIWAIRQAEDLEVT